MKNASFGLGFALVVAAVPAFAEEFFVGPTVITPGEDWTNYLRLADLDGDADLDLIVPSCGGFFTNPTAEPFRIFTNTNGTFSETTAAQLGAPVTVAARVVAVGDIDGDGDVDMFLPNAAGDADRLYVNAGGGTFEDEASARLPAAANASRSAGARFGDVDGDGDLDLLVSLGYDAPDTPVARLLLNDGAGVFSDASASLPMAIPGMDIDDVDFVDVDRDFDLDVLLNAHNGASSLWRNDGAGGFTDISANLPPPGSGSFHYGPSACDVDGDGDLDIVIDNIGGPPRREQLLLNDGAGQFVDATSQLGVNATADDNGVMCVDVDDDGDFDLVIPSLSNNERILMNDGAGNFTLEPGGFPSVQDPTLWMDLGDVDGDGRIDAVTGQGEGAPVSNHVSRVYLGGGVMPVDSTAPVLIATQSIDGIDTSAPFSLRVAVSDRSVTDSGPRVRVFANLSGEGAPVVEATFVGGDLFQLAMPAATGPTDAQICARDAQGNENCAPAISYSGDGGSGGNGNGGQPAGGNGVGGAAGTGTGGDNGLTLDDGGCGCQIVGDTNRWRSWWIAAMAVIALRSGRRASRGRASRIR